MIQRKVCLLGSFGVGKTSLVERFVRDIFVSKYTSTVGVKISTKELKLGHHDVLLLLWDLAGEDSRSQVQTSYLRGAAGYFLVVDGTWAESLATAKGIRRRAIEAVGPIPYMLVVNKSDLWNKWEITTAELEKLEAEGWKIQVTSAKTGDGVEEMFLRLTEDVLSDRGMIVAEDESSDSRASVMLSGRLRLFLCHSSDDKQEVRNLHRSLRNDGFEPWLDEEDLLAGQNWKVEIPKAVRKSDVVLVCLSQRSTTKEGYVQKEIKLALDVAEEKPEGRIFVIPVRLSDCSLPERLSHLQSVNLFEGDGYDKLKRALWTRLGELTCSSFNLI
ncbi:MAG: TIR domain-containing protein [Candidatus Korobacteraceae bacterium]